jgi:hypothetical protein
MGGIIHGSGKNASRLTMEGRFADHVWTLEEIIGFMDKQPIAVMG